MVRLFQDKRLRLAIAGALLLVVGYAIHPYFINTVSYSAFVNAKLVRISAPIGGLAETLPVDGEYIEQARTLNLLEAVAPDRRRLGELEQQRASNLERLMLARDHLATLQEREAALTVRTDSLKGYAKAISVQNAVLSQAELDTCRVEEQRLRADRDRSARLAETGATPHLTVTLAQFELDAQGARCTAAEARLERAHLAEEAAQEDIFLGDGFNDAPYSVQELDRLFLRRLDLQAQVGEAEVLDRELTRMVAEERDRLDRATRFEATLPAQHVVWSVGASEGGAVVEGQTLMELADCSARFVSVLLGERAVSSVEVGDAAAVRLVGQNRWVRGRVSSVSGSAARRDIQLLAAESPEPSPRRFLVEVSLPPSALGEHDGDRCSVGRMAEVRFHRFALDLPFNMAGADSPATDPS